MANSVDVFTANGCVELQSKSLIITCALTSKGTVHYVIQKIKYNGHFEGHLKEGVSWINIKQPV